MWDNSDFQEDLREMKHLLKTRTNPTIRNSFKVLVSQEFADKHKLKQNDLHQGCRIMIGHHLERQ